MAQEEWFPIDVAGLDPHNPGKSVYGAKVGSKRLCLAHYEGKWHALDARCPHANGPLDGGKLGEGTVVCPWHRFEFDLKTGQSESGGYYVNTYQVKIKNQRLWVMFNPRKRWWKFW